jgi:hypothetical protein
LVLPSAVTVPFTLLETAWGRVGDPGLDRMISRLMLPVSLMIPWSLAAAAAAVVAAAAAAAWRVVVMATGLNILRRTWGCEQTVVSCSVEQELHCIIPGSCCFARGPTAGAYGVPLLWRPVGPPTTPPAKPHCAPRLVLPTLPLLESLLSTHLAWALWWGWPQRPWQESGVPMSSPVVDTHPPPLGPDGIRQQACSP